MHGFFPTLFVEFVECICASLGSNFERPLFPEILLGWEFFETFHLAQVPGAVAKGSGGANGAGYQVVTFEGRPARNQNVECLVRSCKQ